MNYTGNDTHNDTWEWGNDSYNDHTSWSWTRDLGNALEAYRDTSPVCILLSLQVVVLNSFVIHHYKNSMKSFVPMMYLMVSSADILTAISVVHQSIITILSSHGLISNRWLKWNYAVAYTLMSLSYRASIFYNVVLAVSRTINILNPFYRWGLLNHILSKYLSFAKLFL